MTKPTSSRTSTSLKTAPKPFHDGPSGDPAERDETGRARVDSDSSVRNRFHPSVGPRRKPHAGRFDDDGRTSRPCPVLRWNRLPKAVTGMWGADPSVFTSPSVPWNLRREWSSRPQGLSPKGRSPTTFLPEMFGYGPVLPFDRVVLKARLNPSMAATQGLSAQNHARPVFAVLRASQGQWA